VTSSATVLYQMDNNRAEFQLILILLWHGGSPRKDAKSHGLCGGENEMKECDLC
jgi:hypothetical protein